MGSTHHNNGKKHKVIKKDHFHKKALEISFTNENFRYFYFYYKNNTVVPRHSNNGRQKIANNDWERQRSSGIPLLKNEKFVDRLQNRLVSKKLCKKLLTFHFQMRPWLLTRSILFFSLDLDWFFCHELV